MKRTEEYETVNLATKVSKKEMSVIKEMVAELGFATPYELLKFIVAALIRYADVWHKGDAECQGAVSEFFSLFSTIKNKKGLTRKIDLCKPQLIIAVYGGGQVVAYRLKDGRLATTRNVEKSVGELTQLTHPTTHAMLAKVAHAYGLRSVPKVIEQLATDACREIGETEFDELGFVQNEYGEVPRRTRKDLPR